MKVFVIVLLWLPIFGFSQNADWKELQGKIDSAIKQHGVVKVERNYTIDQPLIAADWNGKEYRQVYFQMLGTGSMWDVGANSVIRATFKNAPILSIQKGKGVIIKGITLLGSYVTQKSPYGIPFENFGDPSCRDSRFSPYAGICIDPFSGDLPADGGYPTLKAWYRGPQTRSGSTGIRIEDCTIGNVTIGVITSPNGYTQNAEIITLQNIRIGACKAGIAGCQSQEKMNRIINLGCWESCHTLFVFNKYGAGQPGNWFIEGVNIAGSVANIIYRLSSGWGPMFMSKVFAENVESIGVWDGDSGDVLSEAFINFKYKNELGYLPDYQLFSNSLTILNSNLRYYGELKQPVVLRGIKNSPTNSFYVPPVTNKYGWDSTNIKGFKIDQPFYPADEDVTDHKATVRVRPNSVEAGQYVVFMQMADWSYLGQGMITEVKGDQATIGFISPSVKNLKNYRIGVYKK
ncbi:hypothetical protein [Flavihumibacter profundi]|uniref:hypothetical protein n=1 Tax=Flavihumibacter profundi TaxID=2716883 RepID=UPI001CC73F55|nr:hypothetical protein [Flavihumibacter profundi]MBZ5859012.1 hypothetical protein [Flavihumibacter profundi]